jgi:hypothetical protein
MPGRPYINRQAVECVSVLRSDLETLWYTFEVTPVGVLPYVPTKARNDATKVAIPQRRLCQSYVITFRQSVVLRDYRGFLPTVVCEDLLAEG